MQHRASVHRVGNQRTDVRGIERSTVPDDDMLRTRATYDAIASRRVVENARDRTAVAGWLARFARGLPAGALVVDLGAGPGMDAVELRRCGLRAFSLDFSMGMLRAGVAEYPGPRVQADARRLPFRAGALAGIWASASLLHLSRPHAAQALEAARRTLAPGGRLLMSVKQGHGSETETTRYGMPRFFQVLVRRRPRRGARRRRVPRHRCRDRSIAARRLARPAGRADRLTPAAARAPPIDVRVTTPPGSRRPARASRRAGRDRRRRRGR